MESEHVNMRDRYANSSFNVGIGEVPEYLQFKKKQLQGCVQQKKKIKQVLVHNPNLTAGNILNIRFASNNFIDPQSVKLGFQFAVKLVNGANPVGNAKFNDDCALQGMIRSIKVSSAGGGKQLESIYNYNLLQKLQYALSVSQTAKQTQLWTEGFGSVPGASTITNGPVLVAAAAGVVGTQYLIPLHTGLLGGNTRLIPNGLIQLSVDIELAPLLDFCVSAGNVDTTVYYVNNCYVTYDEYIVSDAYRSIFESAVRTSGLSFDYNTITNVETQLAGANLNIQSVVVDSSKQLLSLYTVMRPAGATTGTTATNLETINGSKVTSMQWKVGTVNYPEFVLTNTADMFQMALQSMNRAGVLMSSMPISWSKYAGNGRCFFGGVDFEQTRTSPDSNVYSGISTNGNQITFQATLSDTNVSEANAGAVASANLAHGDGDTGMVIDHFLYHSRILSISPVGGVVVDY